MEAARQAKRMRYDQIIESESLECFYSTGTDNGDLSSMSGEYPFRGEEWWPDWGMAAADPEVLSFLSGKLVGIYFKTREHFFQWAKALHAAKGRFAAENAAKATELLRLPPKGAHDLTQAGKMKGHDATSWARTRVAVMELGAALQARHNGDFATRLICTGDALLAESKAFGKDAAFWGIGMLADEAKKTPVAARKQVWGANEHGQVLMAVRAALRAEAGEV